MARGSGYARGTKHPLAKLSEAVVAFVRSSGDTTGALARRFGVCKKTLRAARRGDTWRHVKGIGINS
jgi:transposase-like protein